MKAILIILALSLTACTTIQTPNAKVQTAGSAKVVAVGADGSVRIEDLSSPLQSAISAVNTGVFAWLSGTIIR